MSQKLMWKWKEDSNVIVVSIIKDQRVRLALDALNVLFVCRFSEHIERHLRSFTGPIQNLPCLVSFAGDFVCVPMGLLTSGVTIESFDKVGGGPVGRTVAAGTDLGGLVLVAECTCLR